MTRSVAASRSDRVYGEPAMVLHQWPHKESSLILELMTRHHGRVPLVAKGARRPRSEMRGLLQAFRPLQVSWTGRGEVKVLTDVDWVGGVPCLPGPCLMLGFYVNELLLRLIAREDAHPEVFDRYLKMLVQFSHHHAPESALRCFERGLLKDLGYEWVPRVDASGQGIVAGLQYRVRIGQAPELIPGAEPGEGPPRRAQDEHDWIHVSGEVLLAWSDDDFDDPLIARAARPLMRRALASLLGDRPLSTRAFLLDLQHRDWLGETFLESRANSEGAGDD